MIGYSASLGISGSSGCAFLADAVRCSISGCIGYSVGFVGSSFTRFSTSSAASGISPTLSVHIAKEVLLLHKLLGMGVLSCQYLFVLVHHLPGKAFPNLFSLVEKHYPVAVLHYRA